MPSHVKVKIIHDEESLYKQGRRILKMCDFNSEFISDANNNTKTLLERNALKLPDSNNPIESPIVLDENTTSTKEVDLVQKMIDQIASIVITKTGIKELPRYDLPKNKGSANSSMSLDEKRKDLYTAFILAGKCCYDVQYKSKEEQMSAARGVVTEINKNPSLTPDNTTDIMPGRLICSPQDYNELLPGQSKKRKIRNGGIIVPSSGRRKRKK